MLTWCCFSQLKKIIGYYWGKGTGSSLRDALAFLLCHSGILRGESARDMQLPDLHSIELPNEGLSRCDALIMVLLQVGFPPYLSISLLTLPLHSPQSKKLQIFQFLKPYLEFYTLFIGKDQPFWASRDLRGHKAQGGGRLPPRSSCLLPLLALACGS